jgi:hypothetical protein
VVTPEDMAEGDAILAAMEQNNSCIRLPRLDDMAENEVSPKTEVNFPDFFPFNQVTGARHQNKGKVRVSNTITSDSQSRRKEDRLQGLYVPLR